MLSQLTAQTNTDQATNAVLSQEKMAPEATDYDSSVEPLDQYLDNIEKNILFNTLEKNRWNRTAAAKELGMTFRSLRYRLKKLRLDIDKQD